MLNTFQNELKVVKVCLVSEPSLYANAALHSAEDAVQLIAKELAQYDREIFCVLNLKASCEIINMNVVSIGTLDAALISCREVFKASILSNASSIIAVHNHPSSNIHPSANDISVTKKLYDAGELLDIHLLDHIIVAAESGDYYSMNEHKMLSDHSV